VQLDLCKISQKVVVATCLTESDIHVHLKALPISAFFLCSAKAFDDEDRAKYDPSIEELMIEYGSDTGLMGKPEGSKSCQQQTQLLSQQKRKKTSCNELLRPT
jgi:hypothetical protein